MSPDETWTELLGGVVEQAYCHQASCHLGFKQRGHYVELEHLDQTQDHPFGAKRVVCLDNLYNLSARLARWLAQVHPRPTVLLSGR